VVFFITFIHRKSSDTATFAIMSFNEKYEAVIGLEVHAQLQTNSKLFCGDAVAFGAEPNTQVSPITLGHPGTLPKTNKKAVEFAIKLGLACHCEIELHNYFARKNYFYPDLPKGYQISQHTTPICKGGYVGIKIDQQEKNIVLNRIHLEEDAGKSIHDIYEDKSCIDLNRAGTPLVEIVTEPVMHNSDEAYQYITELRRLVRWLNICDGNMEEGSLRCDANISIRLKGEKKLGTKVEVKNLNSIRNVKRAIDYEINRMIQVVENGGAITQQTRSFDANSETTFSIRDKEEANDYRYFADPDLAPFHLTEAYISTVKNSLPALPQQRIHHYQTQYHLSEYDSSQLCDERSTADYFEQVIQFTKNYKAVANWLLGPVRQQLNETHSSFQHILLQPATLASLIQLVEEGKLNFSVASSKLLPVLLQENKDPLTLATDLNLIQISDDGALEKWVEDVITKMPDKVAAYKKGKKGLIGLFVGEIKKLSKGKADPKKVTELLQTKLNE
jgi:aspartyl-tRNA(Asn)/glutamyl-tRNA(Gln) amidotransferase subunit B